MLEARLTRMNPHKNERVESVLIFYNKRDFIAESLDKIARIERSPEIVLLSIEELMNSATVIHQFFENKFPVTIIKRSNGTQIIPGSFDLVFNRINNFFYHNFLNGKDAAYASMEWFALINSIFHSLKARMVNFNSQLLLNNYSINPLIFLNLCRKHKIKIEPLKITGSVPEKNDVLTHGTTRTLFLKNHLHGDIPSPLKKKINALMKDLHIDFAEIFFNKGNVVSYNPFPAFANKNDLYFIYQTFMSLTQRSYAVDSRNQ